MADRLEECGQSSSILPLPDKHETQINALAGDRGMQVLALLAPIGSGLTLGFLQKRPRERPGLPWVSLATGLLVAMMLAFQLRTPILLELLARTPAILTEGQVWRAGTALFVQDGGLAGGIFNLVLLASIGPIAERCLGSLRWAIAYFGGGVMTELAALAWQPHGAGNSIACYALAGTLVVTGLARRRDWLYLATSLAGTAGASVLLARQDIHGIGFVVGMSIGAAVTWFRRPAVPAEQS